MSPTPPVVTVASWPLAGVTSTAPAVSTTMRESEPWFKDNA
eukprot:CAMPEP_0179717462 /NCGR_PEP_ID=MMETSP0938-20121108/2399_1 /TAXON_ID=548131 ORGANISM="Ostreococcus mediterraneus, Strain clade-D-RCC1107" /NCGR_SAMPLE_ID=MMETSP0938 /ASSEMBLY_ACC=CAM_ASM_000576 /LENGTH=40 /DNA_ID= /DNA_START= /DNA_END= /DNA_ORIENTATION=